jgi:hypothetical protein
MTSKGLGSLPCVSFKGRAGEECRIFSVRDSRSVCIPYDLQSICVFRRADVQHHSFLFLQDKAVVARKAEQPESEEVRQKRVRQKALKALKATQKVQGLTDAGSGLIHNPETRHGDSRVAPRTSHESGSDEEDNLLLAQPKASSVTARQLAPQQAQRPASKVAVGGLSRQAAGPHKASVPASKPGEHLKRSKMPTDAQQGDHNTKKKLKSQATIGHRDKMVVHNQAASQSNAKMCAALSSYSDNCCSKRISSEILCATDCTRCSNGLHPCFSSTQQAMSHPTPCVYVRNQTSVMRTITHEYVLAAR